MSTSVEPIEDIIPNPPALETSQDHPAHFDWRVLLFLLLLSGVSFFCF